MTPFHVLVLGGHGKIAQILTRLLVRRAWEVTSIVRTPDQIPEIENLGKEGPGKLNVLARSLEEVKSDEQAGSVLDEVKPDMVVWSAGAGGKGAPERTFLIDRDAACHFIRAAAARQSITKFLMISYVGSRRAKPSWWDDSQWAAMQEANNGILARYHQAKIVADEELYLASKKRGPGFAGICLRPGTLTMEPKGRVALGRLPTARGKVSRESVAHVADELLATEGVKTSWVDILDGDEQIGEAVTKVVSTGVDAIEGEPVREKA